MLPQQEKSIPSRMSAPQPAPAEFDAFEVAMRPMVSPDDDAVNGGKFAPADGERGRRGARCARVAVVGGMLRRDIVGCRAPAM